MNDFSDTLLASCLKQSVQANNLNHVIEVVQDDVHSAQLPQHTNILICEMMETGLMDEMQVTAINALRERNIITAETRLIPFQYETFIELGFTDFSYYGYKIFAPKHEWLHYVSGNGWLPTSFHAHTSPHRINTTDFRQFIQGAVDTLLAIEVETNGVVNAIRISSRARLAENLVLTATNALNGDKILPISEMHLTERQTIRMQVSYQMGAGLASFQAKLLQE